MENLDTFFIIDKIEEMFFYSPLSVNVLSVTQEDVREELINSNNFNMLTFESTDDSPFEVDINESQFLNDKYYDETWIEVECCDPYVFVCLRKNGNNLEISAIEVNNEYRNCGYGKMVVEGIENFAETAGFENVVVKAFDNSAKGFWLNLGYVENIDGWLVKECNY